VKVTRATLNDGMREVILTAPLELLIIYPRRGPHGKHRLLLSRIVLGMFPDPMPSNRRPIVASIGSRGNVFTESLPRNESIRHNIRFGLGT
jgi:hypothetical protein